LPTLPHFGLSINPVFRERIQYRNFRQNARVARHFCQNLTGIVGMEQAWRRKIWPKVGMRWKNLTPRQLLDRLVSFPTVSRESNLPLVDWLEAYLTGHGVRCFRHWNEDRQKAALIAHAGPWVPGGGGPVGHSDVVPVDGQAWTSDPWTVTERDGRLYGRGTCDMKGFVALAVWAVVRGAAAGVRRPLQLALSYDEEVGCTGAPPMIQTMLARWCPRPPVIVIGEPSPDAADHRAQGRHGLSRPHEGV
jgi:acetylornithine deacetylase